MPNIIVKIPANTLSLSSQKNLVDEITLAAATAEQIPNEIKNRLLCWVIVEEISSSMWNCGANDVSATLLPIMLQINLPQGVLDDNSRQLYIEAIDQALHKALQHEPRRIMNSCIINEVADGNWGINGSIWKLNDFAKHAGYLHLQPKQAENITL